MRRPACAHRSDVSFGRRPPIRPLALAASSPAQDLLAEAVITPLARAVKLGIATDEERQRQEVWEQYSVLVSRVDTASPDWPDVPVSQ
ncbi:tail fiber assembly protein [Salmonella enterica subsp. enterica serovar Reading]|nr:tail fiber assembly protein [Salmonella enterica]EGB1029333.1 tail fiber assembly protein [Salmonella enterica subsp. enterica serovar Reading]